MKKTAKQVLAFVIVMTMVFSLGAFAFAAEFTDMPAKEHWAYNGLNAAVSNGLLKGDNNKLNPTGNLSRAEMATMVNRAFGAAQTADMSKFNDVSKSAWYYIEMAKAVKMGTFTGDGAIMRPQDSISRQEAFVVLARALQLKAGDATVLNKFSDNALIADWAKPALAAMTTAGYVNGDNGKANPTGTITRQEFAQVMYNAVKTYVNKAETMTSVAEGNVMVNVPGATLKNLTVKGDLIVGDGVGAGDFTLDNVKVDGRVVVRGGGENSIKITNGSSVGNIVISKTSDGGVRVVADASSSVQVVVVADGNDSVIVDGKVDTLTIEGKADVEIKGEVKNVEVKADAKGATVEVAKGAKVEKLDSKASDVKVAGEGKITEATISGNNTKLDVPGTTVTVDNGVEGTVVGDKPVPGGSVVVAEPSAPTGGGGGGTLPVNYKKNIDDAITSAAAFAANSMTGTSANSVIVSFVSNTNGGTITVSYNQDVKNCYDTLGKVFGDIKDKILNSNAATVSNYVKLVTENINTITAGANDSVFTVTNNFTPNDVINYIGTLTYVPKNGGSEVEVSSSVQTNTLPVSFNVSVVAKDGTTYTYTIVRALV
jgi:hypothetical protein